tara:strand:+ start:24 stop:473 length:450 start_codon:yes stop_codon:yes gene_type:complete
MPAGRPRKPTALKLIHGSRDRHKNKNEPKPTGLAEMPEWLNPAAVSCWELLAPELEAIGLLTNVDANAMAIYCTAYAEMVEAEAELLQGGKTQVTKDGFKRVSPWLNIRNEAQKRMQQIGAQFGLTPATRTKIEVMPKTTDNTKAAYIA